VDAEFIETSCGRKLAEEQKSRWSGSDRDVKALFVVEQLEMELLEMKECWNVGG
jgi:hypothetical protein